MAALRLSLCILLAATLPRAAENTAPYSILDSITAEELDAARLPQPPAELSGAPGRNDFDLEANFRELYEQVAREYGLKVAFDEDFQSGNTNRLRFEDADFREALRIV